MGRQHDPRSFCLTQVLRVFDAVTEGLPLSPHPQVRGWQAGMAAAGTLCVTPGLPGTTSGAGVMPECVTGG